MKELGGGVIQKCTSMYMHFAACSSSSCRTRALMAQLANDMSARLGVGFNPRK